MSKKDVTKPGHFKLAGKNRPGKDTVPEGHKQDYTKEKAWEEGFAEGTAPLPGMRAKRRAEAKSNPPGGAVKHAGNG